MERQVLIVKFDKSANLKSLEVLDAKAGRRLAHVERVTPTFGQELTVIGQILGNFRRFTGANDPANQ
jgi:outer membrane protein assembly factor BamE (lipoprotein component of BamABCDE complex)